MGTPASRATSKIAAAAGWANPNAWARGCSLIPRAPRARQLFLGVEPAVRNQPPVALASPLEHAVVGHAIGGVALRIVEGKHDRTPCRIDLVERRQKRGRIERATIFVGAEMSMGIDDAARGGEPRELGTERRVRVAVHPGSIARRRRAGATRSVHSRQIGVYKSPCRG